MKAGRRNSKCAQGGSCSGSCGLRYRVWSRPGELEVGARCWKSGGGAAGATFGSMSSRTDAIRFSGAADLAMLCPAARVPWTGGWQVGSGDGALRSGEHVVSAAAGAVGQHRTRTFVGAGCFKLAAPRRQSKQRGHREGRRGLLHSRSCTVLQRHGCCVSSSSVLRKGPLFDAPEGS